MGRPSKRSPTWTIGQRNHSTHACWNCGNAHNLGDCPKQGDQVRIDHAKTEYNKSNPRKTDQRGGGGAKSYSRGKFNKPKPGEAFATSTGLGMHLASPAMGGQPLTLQAFTLLGPKTRVASLFLIIILSVWLKMAIHLEMAQESQARTNQLPCQPTHQQS